MATVRYPSEFAGDPKTDYLEIKFIRKNYKSNDIEYNQEGDTIYLNMPQKLTETISQNFANAQKGELGSPDIFAGAFAGNAFLRSAQRMVENFALGKSVEVMSKLGASQLTDNGLLSATSGVVFNPNMEVLYEGPDFRRFNFQFVMFTKSKTDAVAIKQIVNAFRVASLPTSSGSPDTNQLASVFTDVAQAESASAIASLAAGAAANALGVGGTGNLSSLFGAAGTFASGIGSRAAVLFGGSNRFITQPPFVLLTYKRGTSEHPFIPSLLPAAINSMSIDYTPTGNYTQLNQNAEGDNGATTVGVTITLQLTEVANLFGDTLFTNRAPGVTSTKTSNKFGPGF
jgi:hypothetical protein